MSFCITNHQDIAPLQIKMKEITTVGTLQLTDNFRTDFPVNT